MADKKTEALKIVEEGLKELESAKGSVTVGVQKLSRAAKYLDDNEKNVWAEIQLANPHYINPLNKFIKACESMSDIEESDRNYDGVEKLVAEMEKLGIVYDTHVRPSINFKSDQASGGLHSVDFIEESYKNLVKEKRGNDRTLYQKNLKWHLDYIKKTAHEYLFDLHDKLKFSGTITSSFDLLKNAVDDRLLDLDPDIAGQLMLAFKSVSSDNKEEWSHALTTCRRLLESLADKLYPANDLKLGNRTFKQNQFVNRLWQFMNDAIESDSNRDLAQMHVNYLGLWLEKANKITNKGVHDEVSQHEATKTVFHIYLMLADMLDYLDPSAVSKTTKPSLATASLDDIEVHLNVSRNVAKDIFKARLNNGGLTLEQLAEVKGVGPKTVATAKDVFEF